MAAKNGHRRLACRWIALWWPSRGAPVGGRLQQHIQFPVRQRGSRLLSMRVVRVDIWQCLSGIVSVICHVSRLSLDDLAVWVLVCAAPVTQMRTTQPRGFQEEVWPGQRPRLRCPSFSKDFASVERAATRLLAAMRAAPFRFLFIKPQRRAPCAAGPRRSPSDQVNFPKLGQAS